MVMITRSMTRASALNDEDVEQSMEVECCYNGTDNVTVFEDEKDYSEREFTPMEYKAMQAFDSLAFFMECEVRKAHVLGNRCPLSFGIKENIVVADDVFDNMNLYIDAIRHTLWRCVLVGLGHGSPEDCASALYVKDICVTLKISYVYFQTEIWAPMLNNVLMLMRSINKPIVDPVRECRELVNSVITQKDSLDLVQGFCKAFENIIGFYTRFFLDYGFE